MAVDNVFVEFGCCLANVGLGLRTQEGVEDLLLGAQGIGG